MKKDLRVKLYLKGYEEGQKEAWKEIKRLTKSHDGWDLTSRIESKIGTLYQDVAAKKAELIEDGSLMEIDDEKKGKENRERDINWDGRYYLMIEDSPQKCIATLDALVQNGYKGLVISTESPSKLKYKYGLPDTDLSYILLQKSNFGLGKNETSKSKVCSPSNLNNLSSAIGHFIKESSDKKPVIVLHGLGNISLYYDLNKVLKFIDWIKEKLDPKEGYLLASIPHSEYQTQELGKFKGHFDEYIDDR